MTVWIAVATTEMNDTYIYAFEYEPTVEEVITLVFNYEKNSDTIEWYRDTTDVIIQQKHVKTR
jgi:hypothetical protein